MRKVMKKVVSMPSILFLSLHFFSGMGNGKKWALRGGITIGNFYKDNNMILGEALVKAYNLEKEYAINPCVIIDKKLAKLAEKTAEQFIMPMPEVLRNKGRTLIISSDSSYYYLNYQIVLYLDEKADFNDGKQLFFQLKEYLISKKINMQIIQKLKQFAINTNGL